MRRTLVFVVFLTGCGTHTVTVTTVETQVRTITAPEKPSASVPLRVDGYYTGDTLPLSMLVPRGTAVAGAAVRTLYRSEGCRDDMVATLEGRALVVYRGEKKDPKTGGQIHCCWLRWRREATRWPGERRAPPTITFVRRPPARLFG